jgi:hypothetical protein
MMGGLTLNTKSHRSHHKKIIPVEQSLSQSPISRFFAPLMEKKLDESSLLYILFNSGNVEFCLKVAILVIKTAI